MTTPRLLVEIAASLGTFQSDFGKASQIAEHNAARINRSVENMRSSVVSFGKTLAASIGIPLGVAGVVEVFRQIEARAEAAQRSVAQLNAVLKATGNAAGQTPAGLEGLNKQLQGSSVFDSNSIREAETALLRFRTVQGDTFRDAIKLVPDLATALGVTLPDAAQALGRAFQNPARGLLALRAAGLSLTQQQIDLIARMRESGDASHAYQTIIDALRGSIGGAAESDTSGLYGSTKRLTRSFNDLEEVYGKKLFGDNHTVIESLIGFFDRLKTKVEETRISFLDLLKPGELFKQAFGIGGQIATGFQPQPTREVSGKISGLPDVAQQNADAAAANEKQKEIDDAAYTAQQENIKRRAAGAASLYAFELAQQKSFLDLQQAQYDFAYSHAYISTKQFFDEQRQAAAQATENQRANLGKQGQLIEAAANAPSTSRPERLALINQLQGIANQSDQAALDLKKKILEIDQKEADAIEKQKDEYEGLRVKLMELNGDSVGAAGASFDLANKVRIRGLQHEIATGDELARKRAEAALADESQLRQRAVEQAALNKITAAFGDITDEISIQQARVNIAESGGHITEIDAINQRAAAAQSLIPKLNTLIASYEEVAAAAAAANDPEKEAAALVAIDKLKLQVDQLAAASDVLAKKFTDVFTNSLANGITEFVTGAKSAKESIKDIARSIEQQLVSIASKNVAEKLFSSSGAFGGVGDFFAKMFGGGTTGSGGDLLSSLFGGSGSGGGTAGVAALGSTATVASTGLSAVALAAQGAAAALASVAASSAASGAGSLFGGFSGFGGGFTNPLSDIMGFVPGFASGTDFAPGGLALVGERGPEVVHLPRGSQVIPNNVVKGKFGRGTMIHAPINITVAGSTTSKTAEQIGVEVSRALRRTSMRTG